MQTQHDTMATAPFDGNNEPSGPQTKLRGDLSTHDLLQRIDMLIMETDYLRESVDALGKIKGNEPGAPHSPGDIGTQAKAHAIAQVIEQREQTNREMIALLKRMYDDLSPAIITRERSRSPEETKLLERLIDQSAEMSEETLRTFLEKLA